MKLNPHVKAWQHFETQRSQFNQHKRAFLQGYTAHLQSAAAAHMEEVGSCSVLHPVSSVLLGGQAMKSS